ncbi:hypothetical protein AA958_30430 [Streptomyces sp. CNQ-509]|nr:hypothetical protein AA958_30430 [Streptomyces sp. CNQ-509]
MPGGSIPGRSGDGSDGHGFLGRWQEEWVPRADGQEDYQEDEEQDEGGGGAGFAVGGPGRRRR